ncbi:hypothetical protein HHI36_001575 [Cryptolaemus montrouzieri]|uniref:NADH-ubiquinone oxidoreductase 15 kDa subunit n=1 Tax=Cryptolaemus montrouzieri TaxID=559131 RepID=A0ABD2P8U0_9CUCU
MSLSPYFKSPLTDLTGAIVSHQWFGRCQKIEEKALDCIEAYGLEKGLKQCEPLINDFKECSLRRKQFARFEAMVLERERQYKSGELKKGDRYASPPVIDSY